MQAAGPVASMCFLPIFLEILCIIFACLIRKVSAALSCRYLLIIPGSSPSLVHNRPFQSFTTICNFAPSFDTRCSPSTTFLRMKCVIYHAGASMRLC